MAKKKLTRKELLKSPDEFLTLSSRVGNFVKAHARLFQSVGIGIVCIILIYLGINTYINRVNKKGQEAFNAALASFADQVADIGKTGNLKKTAVDFKAVENKYGRARVSRLVPPELAYINYLEKDYGKAIPLYQEYLKGLPQHSPYRSLARLALAACYEEKAEYARAAEALNTVLAAPSDTFKAQAMLSLARVYRLEGKVKESKKILTEFLVKYKNSPYAPLAKAHLNGYPRS